MTAHPTCAECATPLTAPARGPAPTYCSGRCRTAAYRQRRQHAPEADRIDAAIDGGTAARGDTPEPPAPEPPAPEPPTEEEYQAFLARERDRTEAIWAEQERERIAATWAERSDAEDTWIAAAEAAAAALDDLRRATRRLSNLIGRRAAAESTGLSPSTVTRWATDDTPARRMLADAARRRDGPSTAE